MVKKKTTKEIRAIDGIIKFQIDDGIESLTISGKESLADLEIDNKNNVTLYLYADGDKINELTSLVPFINLAVKGEGVDPDKQKSVTLSQDLTQFALEIADNSKELASLIKTESSIILDLDGLVQKLLEIAGKLAELEAKNIEQDNRLTDIEAKDLEQDNRLTDIESKDLEQDNRFTVIEAKDLEQDNRLTVIEAKDLEQDTIINNITDFIDNTSAPNFSVKQIKNLINYYEIVSLVTGEQFETTHYDKCYIGNETTIIEGILTINIERYVNGVNDGLATITAVISGYGIKHNGFREKYVIYMETIDNGLIKLECVLEQYGTLPEFKIYGISNDSSENYKIFVNGFNIVPMKVLTPYEEADFN